MALAVLIAIAAPRHIAEVHAVIANDMNVGAHASGESQELDFRIAKVAVIFLNQNVMLLDWIERARILRVHVAPRWAVNDEIDRRRRHIENHQSPGALRYTIAEES